MIKKIIELAFYDHLKEAYNIQKYENYFSFRDKAEMNMYIKNNNLEIKTDYKKISFRLHNTKDKKVIEAIENAENKTNFIRSCILKEIEK